MFIYEVIIVIFSYLDVFTAFLQYNLNDLKTLPKMANRKSEPLHAKLSVTINIYGSKLKPLMDFRSSIVIISSKRPVNISNNDVIE